MARHVPLFYHRVEQPLGDRKTWVRVEARSDECHRVFCSREIKIASHRKQFAEILMLLFRLACPHASDTHCSSMNPGTMETQGLERVASGGAVVAPSKSSLSGQSSERFTIEDITTTERSYL